MHHGGCQGVLRWDPDPEVGRHWPVGTSMFTAALTLFLPFFICSSEGWDKTLWQHTASRLRFSFPLRGGLSLLARGKRETKQKGDLLALSRVA